MSKFQAAVIMLLGLIFCAVLGITAIVYNASIQPTTVIPTVAITTPEPIIHTMTGEGDNVMFFNSPASGSGLIGFYHDGDSNFIVNLLYTDGRFVDQLVNHIGQYEGRKPLVINKGDYQLEITANGNWVVTILPPQFLD